MSQKRPIEHSDEDGAHRESKKPAIHKEDDKDEGSQLEPEEEERLFRLWVKASRYAARAAMDPRNYDARDAFRDAEAKYSKETDRLLSDKGIFYDPNRRAVVEYLKGLDTVTSKLWFQYRPVAREGAMSHEPLEQLVLGIAHRPRVLRRKYDMRILSEETKRNRSTVETLQQYQIRRYFGAFPSKVAVLGPQSSADEPAEPTVRDGVEFRPYLWPSGEEGGRPGGESFNEAFERAVADGCELVVVSMGGGVGVAEGVDLFFPAYPVLLPGGGGGGGGGGAMVLVMTPIQVLQVNGSDPSASDVCRSLLDRIAGVLGAVLEPRDSNRGGGGGGGGSSSSRQLNFDNKAWLEAGGLSTHGGRGGIASDPRVCRVRPGLARHVPRCAHGWMSTDTQTLLAVALEVYKPRAVLELGSWYGLSSRFILQRSVAGCQFYAADWFKNNAHYGRRMDSISPLDKLYLKHLRYETFCANVDPWLHGEEGARECFTVRMDIHEAVSLFEQHKAPLDMVFIDAEKHTQRLVGLLRRIMAAFPSAVIVGDDYVFESVKQAVAELGLAEGRVVTRDEAYLIVPEGQTSEAALQAMAQLEPEYALPPVHARVCGLVEKKEYDEAVREAEEGGMGLTGDLYSPGKTTLHEVCRQKDEAALALLERFCESAARVPVNELGLTPFDYFTHKINFS